MFDPRPVRGAETCGQVRPRLREKVSVNINCLHTVPATLLRRLLSGMNFSAVSALPQVRVAVEPLEHRRQVANDAFQVQLGSMNKVMAFGAIPFDTVHGAF